MAGGHNGSSSRASSEYLSEEESPDYCLIFKHFRENKVEIASAITTPFPFLMSLRDRGYISEQKFQNYQQNCEKLIPVGRVVYDILSDLQNKFSLSLLKLIFSATHLKAYPDLKEILRNFPNGAEQFTRENETCSCVMCSPAFVPEDPEARMGSSQADTVETGNNTTVEKSKGKRGKKKGYNLSRVKRRRPQTVQPKIPRRLRNKKACFSADLLPVTCGTVKGTLHKDKFKQGISIRSIQSEAGDWHTPTEFETLGGYERSKNWKLSVRCYNQPLKLLIQRKFLPSFQGTYGKRKKQRT